MPSRFLCLCLRQGRAISEGRSVDKLIRVIIKNTLARGLYMGGKGTNIYPLHKLTPPMISFAYPERTCE